MKTLSHEELIVLLLAIGVILIFSRVLAELGKMGKMPVVMGELLVGVLLGPTLFGTLLPEWSAHLFPAVGGASVALNSITNLSVIMLLFVAGLEVQLPIMLQQGKSAIITSISSMVIPFSIGFLTVWYFPDFFHITNKNHVFIYSLFLGTALSISALPVISRILMDLGIFKTKVGMIIIAAAIFNDLLGWIIFSGILSLMNKNGEKMALWHTVLWIMGYGLFMLTIGKKIINKSLPFIQTKLSWPGGILSISLGCCFLGAAFTEYIGIHAVLGAFIMGIAFGDSVHLNEKAREIIHQFVTNVFAPLFFVSIGLKVNFYQNFDLSLVSFILILAIIGKIVGAGLGAYFSGLSKNESLAIGFGMNARGAMEIILATLALQAGLIDARMFVALVIMALLTSMMSGPFMKWFLDKDLAKKEALNNKIL
jgi:Kef-type K+ transport system membrane component KefB